MVYNPQCELNRKGLGSKERIKSGDNASYKQGVQDKSNRTDLQDSTWNSAERMREIGVPLFLVGVGACDNAEGYYGH